VFGALWMARPLTRATGKRSQQADARGRRDT
jgi:hypothetical protein